MKTAISVADATFERVEEHAAELGVSRSEFFVRAAKDYMRRLDDAGLTAQIDAALDLTTAGDRPIEDVPAAGRRHLAAQHDEW